MLIAVIKLNCTDPVLYYLIKFTSILDFELSMSYTKNEIANMFVGRMSDCTKTNEKDQKILDAATKVFSDPWF